MLKIQSPVLSMDNYCRIRKRQAKILANVTTVLLIPDFLSRAMLKKAFGMPLQRVELRDMKSFIVSAVPTW